MLNKVYRLVSPKKIEEVIVEEEITKNTVVVRPTFLSICHADQRYYTGTRSQTILRKKLPMALIHEGVGEVVKDYTNTFNSGDRVIIVPNIPIDNNPNIQENYLPTSKFRSSGYDGLMQEYIFTTVDRLVPVLSEIPSNVAAYTELISVALHGIKRLARVMNDDRKVFGVWGDGNLGYITANLLKGLFPESKLFVFGKNESKLNFFSFADQTFLIDEIPKNVKISQAFECVGGSGSYFAIQQIIEHIQPQGSIAIMGVSERPVEINTRLVLEKGLTISGTSRSGYDEFRETIEFLSKHPKEKQRFSNLIGIEKKVDTIEDINEFFEMDINNYWGKSVMEWNL